MEQRVEQGIEQSIPPKLCRQHKTPSLLQSLSPPQNEESPGKKLKAELRKAQIRFWSYELQQELAQEACSEAIDDWRAFVLENAVISLRQPEEALLAYQVAETKGIRTAILLIQKVVGVPVASTKE
eukprot:TRINITY_DN6078_c0_g1_i1.p1 TRINITY_DN6078_c0_g1~~TRINITY_DN6078_c0_g1_i1.p1  ORF type:complete len:126 (-),score=13.96 TRINITY_DN6078_c0_g1_i1:145-522(-)